MSSALISTDLDSEFAAAATAVAASVVGNALRRMIDHPAYACLMLSRYGLHTSPAPAVAARAKMMLDQELNRPYRGALEFGRARDLRVIVEYARYLQEMEAA